MDLHLQQTELTKTLNRFNKIRLYHTQGWMHILPIKYLVKNPQKYGQIQLNTDTHFNAIIMDIDDEELLTEWNAVGLPTPTIQTINQNNNKAHLVWLLNVPVSKKNKKAVKYYKTIVDSIKILISADKAYQNHQTKNFLNTELFRVTYNDVAYDLEDFKRYIIRDRKYVVNNDLYNTKLESTGSRHIDLFNELRLYGYKIAKDRNLQELLEQRAELINETFDTPIKPKAIIKSVRKFCEENANNFKASKKHKQGAMRFKKIKNLSYEQYRAEIKARQTKSANRTATIKKLKVAKKIKITIDFLLRNKIKLTQVNISKHSGIKLRTVKNYTKTIKLFLQKTDGAIRSIRVIVVEAKERSTKPINHWLAHTCNDNITKWLFGINTT